MSQRYPRFLCGAAVLASLLRPSVCLGESPNTLDLLWEAPDECPDRDYMLSSVAALVVSDASRLDEIQILARVTKDAGRYRLQLEAVDGLTHKWRAIDDPSCSVVADAGSLVIALFIEGANPEGWSSEPEPLMPSSPLEPSPLEPGYAAETPPLTLSEPRSSADLRPRARRVEVPPPMAPKGTRRGGPLPAWALVQGEGVVDSGALPEVAYGVRLGVGADWGGERRVLVGGTYLQKARGESETRGIGGKFSLLVGSLQGCQGVAGGWSAAGFCVGVEAGRMRSAGVGGDWSVTRRDAWIAPRLDVEGALSHDAFAFGLTVGAGFPLIRNRYWMENVGPVFRPGWATGRVGLFARVRL